MNKSELIVAISEKIKISKSQTETMLNATLEIIQKTVAKGDEVKIVGFGSFSPKTRKAKTGRNPKTGEPHPIPECTLPSFKPGKDFKDILSKNCKKKI
jgi:DNA-binding protein HU-beta